MGNFEGFESLQIWQRSMDYCESVYEFTATLPPEEKFGLSDQLRRSAASVSANIAEGYGRQASADFARFCRISRGSLYETITLLKLSARLFPSCADTSGITKEASEIAAMLNAFISQLTK
jgi:four helix bundle protein